MLLEVCRTYVSRGIKRRPAPDGAPPVTYDEPDAVLAEQLISRGFVKPVSGQPRMRTNLQRPEREARPHNIMSVARDIIPQIKEAPSPSEKKGLVCPICGAEQRNAPQLRRHMKEVHNTDVE
jgi:hypothetical protein